MAIAVKWVEMLRSGVKKYKPLVCDAQARDVNEADTVTLVRDMLSEVFGFNRYSEVTGEYAINRTYCDLAMKIEGKLVVLCEVKAIGIDLKEQHTRQAVNYAANEGVPWVVLTNARRWQVWFVSLAGKVVRELVLDIDMTAVEPRKDADVVALYPLTRIGVFTGALGAAKQERRALNRHAVGAALLRPAILTALRKELVRLEPAAKISAEALATLLVSDVIKRDVVDAPETAAVEKRFTAIDRRDLRSKEARRIDVETDAQ